jgi:hypothetical protein
MALTRVKISSGSPWEATFVIRAIGDLRRSPHAANALSGSDPDAAHTARDSNLGLRRRPLPQTAINIRKLRTSCDRRRPEETT